MMRALSLSAEERTRIDRDGVPAEHRPLRSVPLIRVRAAGLEAKAGDLVEVRDPGAKEWRWAMVFNDAGDA